MKEKHILDDLFKKKLKEHSSAVPDHLFNGVMAKRKAVASAGPFGSGIIWLLVSGILMVGAGALMSDELMPKEAAVAMVMDENLATRSNGAPSDYYVENEQLHSSKEYTGLESIESRSNIDSDEARTPFNNEQAFIPMNESGNGIPGSSFESENALQRSKGNRLQNYSNENQYNGSDPLNYSSPAELKAGSSKRRLSGAPTSVLKAGAFSSSMNGAEIPIGGKQPEKTTPSSAGLTWLSIRPTSLEGSINDPAPSLTLYLEAQHGPATGRWFVDIGGGYFDLDQTWETDTDQENTDLRVGSESFENSWDIGARAGYQFRNGLSLNTGLMYNSVSSNLYTRKSRLDQTVVVDTSGGFWDIDSNQVQVWVSVYDTITTTIVTDKTVRIQNKYNLIQIPVSVGYSKHVGRFELGINLGAYFDLLISNGGVYPALVDTVYGFNNPPGQEHLALIPADQSIRSGITFVSSLSISYMISEKIHFLVEPTFRRNIIPFSGGGSPYVKLNYFGIRSGLRYFF